jgi:FAD/FMN-containing dehydrogenase
MHDPAGAEATFQNIYGLPDKRSLEYIDFKQDDQISPKNLGELKQIMIRAQQNRRKIKAVGAGYTFSNILETDGLQISLRELKNIWNPDRRLVKSSVNTTHLCQFEAGATVEDLNQWLWPRGQTLLNQPGFEKLNYFGTATTGGHGSGINIGPIASSIKSLDLLNFEKDGSLRHLRIEPDDGITDPDIFANSFPNIQLIQNDDTFYACLVSAGTLGVVYSLIIETQKRFYLKETRRMVEWEDLKPKLWEKLDDETIHSIHIWFNPYSINGSIYCVLSEYHRTDGPPNGKRPWGTSWNGVDESSRVVHWAMELFPKAIPSFLHAALKQTVSDKPVILPNWEALNFGSPNYVKVHASNCGIPVEYTIDAAEALFKLFQSRFEDELFVTCPIGFRFTSPGRAYLSPQFQKATCMIELPLLVGTDGALDTIDAFHEILFNQFEGKPHWGQINRLMTKEYLKKMFPKWESFINVYREFNHGEFDSPFTDQIGLRDLVRELENR